MTPGQVDAAEVGHIPASPLRARSFLLTSETTDKASVIMPTEIRPRRGVRTLEGGGSRTMVDNGTGKPTLQTT